MGLGSAWSHWSREHYWNHWWPMKLKSKQLQLGKWQCQYGMCRWLGIIRCQGICRCSYKQADHWRAPPALWTRFHGPDGQMSIYRPRQFQLIWFGVNQPSGCWVSAFVKFSPWSGQTNEWTNEQTEGDNSIVPLFSFAKGGRQQVGVPV